ncbi:hypothetical protein OSB04_un001344 [Centaurea solstitialis]|uniref:Uncharacterized protein n=1 Tax=Centaurea solstitialis TaxID=347529 RepID=A0AA38W2P6_9ASTR|nr:hypothetical protein OSB04_un001344 [Centaurea solstitialis]
MTDMRFEAKEMPKQSDWTITGDSELAGLIGWESRGKPFSLSDFIDWVWQTVHDHMHMMEMDYLGSAEFKTTYQNCFHTVTNNIGSKDPIRLNISLRKGRFRRDSFSLRIVDWKALKKIIYSFSMRPAKTDDQKGSRASSYALFLVGRNMYGKAERDSEHKSRIKSMAYFGLHLGVWQQRRGVMYMHSFQGGATLLRYSFLDHCGIRHYLGSSDLKVCVTLALKHADGKTGMLSASLSSGRPSRIVAPKTAGSRPVEGAKE